MAVGWLVGGNGYNYYFMYNLTSYSIQDLFLSRMAPHYTFSSLGREVEFQINGKSYKASDDIPADTSLNVFIREHAHLKGTKFMCLEGGCGACIVSVQSVHPTTQKPWNYSVNSCLVPIFACHGWSVTTVEGLGSKSNGYHKIQKRLAAANGTQCGYCTPGMVMNMNSLLEDNPKITMKQIENSFGGNICRCTGYRPILDAFKSFAVDAPDESVKKLADIEDMICPNSKKCNTGFLQCLFKCSAPKLDVKLPKTALMFKMKEGSTWYRPLSVKEVFEIFDMIGDKSYRFIAGNTGQGVYRINKEPEVYIDLNGIPEIHGSEVTNNGITLGANINLTEAMNLFYKLSKEQPGKYTYCQTLGDHIDLIANVPVRNTGTFAGNLTMKHQHEDMPSDLFLFLEMIGATLLIKDNTGVDQNIGLLQYLATDMNKKLIVKINLPVLDNNFYITRSYKIMPRAQNAHAFVNAGFMVKVDKKNGYLVLEEPTILLGGINPQFLHARDTEMFLKGKQLLNDSTLQGALTALENELKPDHVLPDASPAFRKGLAMSLFYKFILSVDPNKVSERNKSGGLLLQRNVSEARQDFDTDKNLWPLNKPVPKIEAIMQCAGEAEYANDIPCLPNQAWGQLVLVDRAAVTVTKIDPSDALKIPGVIAFYSAKDIPGKNNFAPPNFNVFGDEPIFVDGKSDYAGQAAGIIIAETHSLALKAAKMVKITYKNPEKVMINVREIIDNNVKGRITEYGKISPSEQKDDVKYKIKGRWDLKTQFHYTMETITSVVIPKEDHLEVYPTTQWPSALHRAMSLALNIPQHKINIITRRIGGGYGAKVTRPSQSAISCAIAALALQRPIRMVLKMETFMEWGGKRFPVYSDYDVGVNDDGQIQYLNANMYQDDGHVPNDSCVGVALHHVKNCYDPSVWTVKGYGVKTDTASNTWCRAPGSTEAISLIETIMEHISNVVKKDPISVRVANMNKENDPVREMIQDVRKISEYDIRLKDIQQFNKDNRWKKRGIALVPMNYPFDYWSAYHAMVSIYADGTVAVAHGAVEMGQGVNTKVAQVAAHILGIPLELVSINPTTTFITPNNGPTGACLGSEAVAYATKMCCDVLNKRLEPVKQELGPNSNWADIVGKAASENINLNHTYMFTNKDDVKSYNIYGVGVTEVEIDVLTGQYHARRVDMIEDAGQSMSPEVDIGQIEGSFVMGMGYFTCEEAVYNQESGMIYTNRTWNYKPPGPKDIPLDMRVTMRKNAPNPVGVLRSKATGEPPLCLSISVLFAIRNALESAREETGMKEDWFDLDPPYTGERIWLGTLNKKDMFKM